MCVCLCVCVCQSVGAGRWACVQSNTCTKTKESKNQGGRDYNHDHLLEKMNVNMVERILELTVFHWMMVFQRTYRLVLKCILIALS